MAEARLRLGETLVEAGVLTPEALSQALAIQKKQQLRLGTILLQEGFVTESQLVQALSLKLSIPWVSLWRIDIPDDLLDMVPANVAEEFFLMPIYIRRTKSGERALYVAMNDPTDEDALRFVSAMAGIAVKPMIAGPTDIASAIRTYYYDEEEEPPGPESKPVLLEPSSEPSLPPAPPAAPPPPPPPSKSSDAPVPAPPAPPEDLPEEDLEELDEDSLEDATEDEETGTDESDAGDDKKTDDKEKTDVEEKASKGSEPSDGPVFVDKTAAQREAERRLYGVGGRKPGRGFSLTLLDGTTLSFGAPKAAQSPSAAAASGKLTREDLLSGLKAAAQGTPLDDFLPAEKWETYMQAILKILFNKHLVFYEEFLKEIEGIEKK